jgi:hypothetical protein
MKVFAMVGAMVFLAGALDAFSQGGASAAGDGSRRVSSGTSTGNSTGASAVTSSAASTEGVGTKAEGAKEIVVTRRGARAATPGDAEHFTGTATIDRFLVEKAPSHVGGDGGVRGRSSDCVAQSSAGADINRDSGEGVGAAVGRRTAGDARGRRGVDSGRTEALAWSGGGNWRDPYWDSGECGREVGGVDGEGQR